VGHSQSHKCSSCGLAATVSGGKDRGFYVETQTRYCPHCQALADVGLRLWCKEMLPGLLPPSRIDGLLEAEKEFDLCPFCKRPGGEPWVSGSPCPRCGGQLLATDEEFMQWI
jgi:hypothetical protein